MTGISKRFPGVVALDSVAFDVTPGEIVGLVGENGAGKSTLMKILAGIHRPDAGDVRLNGQRVSIHAPAQAAQLGIGVIHQELEIIDNLDVAGNVFLGREHTWCGPLRLIDRRRIYSETEAHLARLGTPLSPRTPLNRLSTAQQQLVAIARALSMKAQILIMDEPTSSLTLNDTERLFQVIRDLRSGGVTIIYVSHRLSEIEALADRVFVLRDGRNAGLLLRQEINRDRLVRLMVGRDVKSRAPDPDARTGRVCLEVDKLRTRRYPRNEVSLAIRHGEILGIAGLIGAGRSELAEAICGVERRVSGRVVLDGEPLTIDSPLDAVRSGVYLVPEDRRHRGLITAMGVRENVTLPALSRFARAGFIDRAAERASARGISGDLRIKAGSLETPVAHLSGGNQQKVVLGKWLSLNPRAILFDEPTKGIDVGAKAEIYQLMRQLARRGTAIMMISSDMEEILGNSDRVAVMHEGRITGILDRAECTPESIMRLAVA